MGDVLKFPNSSPMFGRSRDDFLRLAIQDELFRECCALVTEEDIYYDEDTGLPIFDEEWEYERLAHSYFGYKLGKVIHG